MVHLVEIYKPRARSRRYPLIALGGTMWLCTGSWYDETSVESNLEGGDAARDGLGPEDREVKATESRLGMRLFKCSTRVTGEGSCGLLIEFYKPPAPPRRYTLAVGAETVRGIAGDQENREVKAPESRLGWYKYRACSASTPMNEVTPLSPREIEARRGREGGIWSIGRRVDVRDATASISTDRDGWGGALREIAGDEEDRHVKRPESGLRRDEYPCSKTKDKGGWTWMEWELTGRAKELRPGQATLENTERNREERTGIRGRRATSGGDEGWRQMLLENDNEVSGRRKVRSMTENIRVITDFRAPVIFSRAMTRTGGWSQGRRGWYEAHWVPADWQWERAVWRDGETIGRLQRWLQFRTTECRSTGLNTVGRLASCERMVSEVHGVNERRDSGFQVANVGSQLNTRVEPAMVYKDDLASRVPSSQAQSLFRVFYPKIVGVPQAERVPSALETRLESAAHNRRVFSCFFHQEQMCGLNSTENLHAKARSFVSGRSKEEGGCLRCVWLIGFRRPKICRLLLTTNHNWHFYLATPSHGSLFRRIVLDDSASPQDSFWPLWARSIPFFLVSSKFLRPRAWTTVGRGMH
ncbi:hypothetical protein C8F04DRAFT_1200222 [Mycena alexandri]|uniref:Uncharacterized protein n=1 Tax=Mycena alexandri TaxID=1745969 RepID=A0AAD6WNB7_9AGAR|nr:hypothetical protein C8F04DRAFT_1200222 [Mycena alexandri]